MGRSGLAAHGLVWTGTFFSAALWASFSLPGLWGYLSTRAISCRAGGPAQTLHPAIT